MRAKKLTELGVCRGFAKGWFPKGWFRRMFPRNENRNEGTFAKTTLLETAPLSPSEAFLVVSKRVVSKRVVSTDVPPERKPERGYVRQDHPFTKPPFYLPVSLRQSPPKPYSVGCCFSSGRNLQGHLSSSVDFPSFFWIGGQKSIHQ